MKKQIEAAVREAIRALCDTGELELRDLPSIHVERARDAAHGDYASPVALSLAKTLGRNPRELATRIASSLPASEAIKEVVVAGPGFMNFFLSDASVRQVVAEILTGRERFGHSTIGAGTRVQVEFVSANPTGPLHIGHGRGAAFGDTVAALLVASGFEVSREYYVNDAGRQMDILALSVWLRYLQEVQPELPFPSNGYRGGYVRELSGRLRAEHGADLEFTAGEVLHDLPLDEPQGGDKELYVDALVSRCKQLLGDARYEPLFALARDAIVDDIRDDLEEFGVVFDNWCTESSVVAKGAVDRAVERLRGAGHLYEKDGALWFRSSEFGDEKDRVLLRENGQATYFANDIAYHLDKVERGFDRLIDVWGADHHGYVKRMKGVLEALGEDPERLCVLLVQFANLYRGAKRLPMSTRSGEFVTLRSLRDEVGRDAARFFYVMRKNDQHLDFDLDLAKSRSNENPVYYLQYAHARVCSVMRQLGERGLSWTPEESVAYLELLKEPQEMGLLSVLGRYPEVVESAALACEPHQMAYYLRDLATHFHTYYNAHTIITDDVALRGARLALADATRQVLANGLGLLGVSAPECM